MEYQGIIFDFNGTLFFDNDKHVKAWNDGNVSVVSCESGETSVLYREY